MRILLIMDPGIPVPPPLYGGHERLVYMFAEEYHKQGHEVSLLAGPDSTISGKVYTFGANDLTRTVFQRNKEIWEVWRFLQRHKSEFDLIHNFGRLIYLLPVLNSSAKKIMTYGRPVSTKGIRMFNSLPNKHLVFTACSNYCVSTGNVAGNWKTVYNAIDFSKYELSESVTDDAPLMFLGRLDKIKGVHTAIKIAKATSNMLWIAGNIPQTPDNFEYYKQQIEPQIDGKQIIYLGALNDEEKNFYLRQAKGLLFPIEWDEPFGMVMVEAMACGTPVIAFNRGSVPEVVENRVTGFIAENETEMINKLAHLDKIDRKKCRETAELKFNLNKITTRYLSLF
jgi:glycosyltransferase involved in cell wall biosynthesis